MMSDSLTEMCVLGGCALQHTITDDCKHCGNYRAEIERRRALPLTDGADGLKFKNVSVNDAQPVTPRVYIDKRGWLYKVMAGIGPCSYKARYQKPCYDGNVGWKGYANLPYRRSFADAQKDLDALAAQKGWAKL